MVDCKNYRYQNNPKEEWCREGLDTSFCQYTEQCPYYAKCEDAWELEERHYPDN